MNNTHTSGIVADTRMVIGMTSNYRQGGGGGVQTPVENSVNKTRSYNNSLEQSHISDQVQLHHRSTLLGQHKSYNSSLSNDDENINTDEKGGSTTKENTIETTTATNFKQLSTNQQLVTPHQIANKYQSLSTKNEEIRAKVKHFDFSPNTLVFNDINNNGYKG